MCTATELASGSSPDPALDVLNVILRFVADLDFLIDFGLPAMFSQAVSVRGAITSPSCRSVEASDAGVWPAASASWSTGLRVVKRVSKRWILRQTIASARAWRVGQLPHAEPGTVEIDGWRLRRVGVGEQAHWLYSQGRYEIRDRGSEIFLSDGEDPTAIRAWLTLAAARFGPDLELTGTALLDHEFRRQAAIVAVDLGLNVEQLAAEIADEQRRRQAPSLAPAQVAEPPSFRIVKTHDPRPSEEVSREAATSIDTSPQTPAERIRG